MPTYSYSAQPHMIYVDQTQGERKKQRDFVWGPTASRSVYVWVFPLQSVANSHLSYAMDDEGASTTAATVMNHHTCDDPASTRCMRLSPNGYYYFFLFEIIWPTQIGLAIEKTNDSCKDWLRVLFSAIYVLHIYVRMIFFLGVGFAIRLERFCSIPICIQTLREQTSSKSS